MVCDGPRPPARELKPGILHLARETGLPLWLVRTSYRPCRFLDRSWARFAIPRIGARAACLADGPIRVPADLDRAGLDVLRGEVERRLDRLAERAEATVGVRPLQGRDAGPGPRDGARGSDRERGRRETGT